MLAIHRIVLYKHGVGYFEHQGEVDGDATIEMQFKQNEMNDVLKSLTILDLQGGLVSSISYESTTLRFPNSLKKSPFVYHSRMFFPGYSAS